MLVPKATKQKKQIAAIPEAININNYLVDLDKPVTQEVIFKIQDKIILTYGSLMILTGKPKARKTTFLHAFIASAVTGGGRVDDESESRGLDETTHGEKAINL